jgi:carbonic anhydrase
MPTPSLELDLHRQADALLEESPVLREAARSGKIKVVAGVYNLATGAVELIP